MSLLDADVAAQVRTHGATDYVFVLNFSPARVEYGGEAIDLGPYANMVIERPQI